jgi:hypothetical protein
VLRGGIPVDEQYEGLADPNVHYQGLRSWRVFRSIEGRSSKHEDIEKKLVGDILERLSDLGHKEVALVVDGEIYLCLAKLAHLAQRTDRFDNLVLWPCIFHMRMHPVENLTNDPVHLLMVILPFFFSMGLQQDKMKEKAMQILRKMEAKIAGEKRADDKKVANPNP